MDGLARIYRSDNQQEHARGLVPDQWNVLFLGYRDPLVRPERATDQTDSPGERRVPGDDSLAVGALQERDLRYLPCPGLFGDCGSPQRMGSPPFHIYQGDDPGQFLPLPDSGVWVRLERATGQPGRTRSDADGQNPDLESCP